MSSNTSALVMDTGHHSLMHIYQWQFLPVWEFYTHRAPPLFCPSGVVDMSIDINICNEYILQKGGVTTSTK